jgi:hypothetical protein
MNADLFLERSAHISACGEYRYSLKRRWGEGKLLPFVMLNPSTADANIDDPTICRCMGFARREGAAGIWVVNLFGWRATDPAELDQISYPRGEENIAALAIAVRAAGETPVICAWGSHPLAIDEGRSFVEWARDDLGAHLMCLGKTKGGHPRHPLYVRGDQPLEEYP